MILRAVRSWNACESLHQDLCSTGGEQLMLFDMPCAKVLLAGQTLPSGEEYMRVKCNLITCTQPFPKLQSSHRCTAWPLPGRSAKRRSAEDLAAIDARTANPGHAFTTHTAAETTAVLWVPAVITACTVEPTKKKGANSFTKHAPPDTAMDLLGGVPQELLFCFQPDKLLCCHFVTENRTAHPLACKTKTDAPASYSVKPAKHILMPGASCTIYVYMQPTPEMPQASHRFLLQVDI